VAWGWLAAPRHRFASSFEPSPGQASPPALFMAGSCRSAIAFTVCGAASEAPFTQLSVQRDGASDGPRTLAGDSRRVRFPSHLVHFQPGVLITCSIRAVHKRLQKVRDDGLRGPRSPPAPSQPTGQGMAFRRLEGSWGCGMQGQTLRDRPFQPELVTEHLPHFFVQPKYLNRRPPNRRYPRIFSELRDGPPPTVR
jgi:hypothetical protein